MKKTVIVCGLISGLICTVWAIAWMNICLNSGKPMDMEKGMIYGYASMVLSFSLIFVGIKSFRDRHNGGVISFGKAFKIGLLITLVASTLYVLVWEIDYFFFLPEGVFEQQYTAHILDSMRASGATQAEVDKKALEMADMWKMYSNPFFNMLMTYVEILPVGLVISLIAALLLKRKKKQNGFQAVPA